ncbi:MAG: hypothetical protein O4803_09760 [Trichodesmium sp. St15_bin1_1]|nr:hypothetical protein [Trichodesmium sp. St15_bin1_1]
MHATSLQGFCYGDVVHQFENRYKSTPPVPYFPTPPPKKIGEFQIILAS